MSLADNSFGELPLFDTVELGGVAPREISAVFPNTGADFSQGTSSEFCAVFIE